MSDSGRQPTVSHAPAPGGLGRGVDITLSDPGRLIEAGAAANLTRLASAAVGQMGVTKSGEVRVRVVGDAEMAAAHAKYLGDPTTTDVLTFDMAEGHAVEGSPLDVDILVCADEARRQGAARGHAVEQELLLYVVHGVLHCLGYDDHDPAAAARMHAEEDRVLSTIGVGATYARPETPGAGQGGAP